MKLEPLGERVVVKPKVIEKIGLIHVPDDSMEKRNSLQGTVVAVGPDCEWVKEGDQVLYGKYSGFKLPFTKEYKDHLLMNEEDILAKIHGEEEGE